MQLINPYRSSPARGIPADIRGVIPFELPLLLTSVMLQQHSGQNWGFLVKTCLFLVNLILYSMEDVAAVSPLKNIAAKLTLLAKTGYLHTKTHLWPLKLGLYKT